MARRADPGRSGRPRRLGPGARPTTPATRRSAVPMAMRPAALPPAALRTAALVTVGLVAACGASEPSPLEAYTAPGDACEQALSAVGYADDVLVVLGQERYQDFDDEATSRLAAVAGTLELEVRDWPDRTTRARARAVVPLAEAASELDPEDPLARERALVEYRAAAAELVLACQEALGRY